MGLCVLVWCYWCVGIGWVMVGVVGLWLWCGGVIDVVVRVVVVGDDVGGCQRVCGCLVGVVGVVFDVCVIVCPMWLMRLQ